MAPHRCSLLADTAFHCDLLHPSRCLTRYGQRVHSTVLGRQHSNALCGFRCSGSALIAHARRKTSATCGQPFINRRMFSHDRLLCKEKEPTSVLRCLSLPRCRFLYKLDLAHGARAQLQLAFAGGLEKVQAFCRLLPECDPRWVPARDSCHSDRLQPTRPILHE